MSGLSDLERLAIDQKRLEALNRRNRQSIFRPHFNPHPQRGPIAPKCASAPLPPSVIAASSSAKKPRSDRTKTKVTCTLADKDHFRVEAGYHGGLMNVFKAIPSRVYVKHAALIGDICLTGLSSAVVSIFKHKIDGGALLEAEHFPPIEEKLPKILVDSLLAFQREGVRRALQRHGRVLLADDMGLGKTIQGLSIAAAFRAEWPLLIVTPSSVRFTWREQVIRWLGASLQLTLADIDMVLNVKTFTAGDFIDPDTTTRRPITIFSYDLLSRCASKLGQMSPFGVVIMDESHFLKNLRTQRTKAALPILKAARRVILLSGTPALSRPIELYSQICAVRPELFRGGLHEFGLRYCAAKENLWGWDYSGCSNMQELQIILEETIMIRRMKNDVLDQLPPKRRQVVVLDPGLIKAANSKRRQKQNEVNPTTSVMENHGELLRYFMETSRIKLPAVEQYVSDLLEADRKFILFAHHAEMLDTLSRLLESKGVGYMRIDGKVPSDQRVVLCDRFQTEQSCRVALLSITAAGTGLNLTAACLVVFAELFWNPGVLLQAEDRAYRIGQHDSVCIQYLLAENTADDQIWPLVKSKLEVLSKAGLNRESFDDDMGLQRLQASSKTNLITKTIDLFLTKKEEADDDDDGAVARSHPPSPPPAAGLPNVEVDEFTEDIPPELLQEDPDLDPNPSKLQDVCITSKIEDNFPSSKCLVTTPAPISRARAADLQRQHRLSPLFPSAPQCEARRSAPAKPSLQRRDRILVAASPETASLEDDHSGATSPATSREAPSNVRIAVSASPEETPPDGSADDSCDAFLQNAAEEAEEQWLLANALLDESGF